MAASPGAPVKFRDTDTLRERSTTFSHTATLRDLQDKAAILFGWPTDRSREIHLEYPEDGIAAFDSSESHGSCTVISDDTSWQEVVIHVSIAPESS